MHTRKEGFKAWGRVDIPGIIPTSWVLVAVVAGSDHLYRLWESRLASAGLFQAN